MGLNNKITERFEVTTNVSTQDILQTISDGRQKQTWTDLLVPGTIDYNEINIKDTEIEITRLPKTFAAFRPNGRITIKITKDNNDNQTKLKCEILPFNGNLPTIIGFVIIGLSIWTLLGLLIGRNLNSLIAVIIGWTVFGIIMYLHYLFTKQRLIDYSKIIIKELTRDKKASR